MSEDADHRRSLRALDATNFFLADVETGIGPFVATFLSSQRHWNPGEIGLITGMQNLATVLAQTPAGALIDASHRKRWLVAGSGLLLSLGALGVLFTKTVFLQIVNQVMVGIALAILLPCVSAISLGIVGKAHFSPRVGRNATFTHIGNTLTAAFAGYLAFRSGERWIFYLSAAFGVLAACAALLIRKEDIDDEVARARDTAPEAHAVPLSSVLRDRRVVVFLALVVLFHVANSSMLPLAGQRMAQVLHGRAEVYMAACIVVGQLVMAPVATFTGRMADRLGRKPLFLIGFTALLLRGLLFAYVHAPGAVVLIEVFDGIGTAIAGVTTVLVISDLASGTGRFNVLQGIGQAALGVGAFVGKLASGWLAKTEGYPVTFLCLACLAGLGLVLFATQVEETAPARA